tara:strand:+ start:30277 stop:31632 length:1356 start_codon:yes stop_codon:yes gene_type:complete
MIQTHVTPQNFSLPDNTQQVMLGVFDTDGVFRGKRMSKEKFLNSMRDGFGFCNVVLGWDIDDQLYDNTTFTGWHSGYPDAHVQIIENSKRVLPFEENSLLYLCEFIGHAGKICPRQILKKVLDRAAQHNLFFHSALEYEFFMFEETPQSIQDKGFQNLKPFTTGNHGYSVLRHTVQQAFHESLLNLSRTMNFEIEGLHCETGPGVLEAAIGVDKALNSADKAAIFKTFTKVLAQQQSLMATFMAKWSPNHPGQSGHIHISAQNKNHDALFYDPKREHNISQTMLYSLGGLQHLAPEFTALFAPTINSYTRLVPGFWAPTHSNWGIDNRTCSIRVIEGSAKSQRIEFRAGGADGNPYLALSAAIGAMIWGIENKIIPTAPIEGNAYTQQGEQSIPLPSHLLDATQRLKHSQAAKELFGHDFVEHFTATREWEVRQANQAITDWQLKRYFEAI